jgi:hypothetical protein
VQQKSKIEDKSKSTYFQRQSTWFEGALSLLVLAERAPCWRQPKLFQLSSPCQAQFFATSQRLLWKQLQHHKLFAKHEAPLLTTQFGHLLWLKQLQK